MATTKKKTSKKKTTKRTISTKTGSESPLLAAMSTLDKTLKTKDWRTDLDPASLRESLPHIPSGSIVVDYLIGGKKNNMGVAPCPGVPRGRILQLYGHEGAGKTTLALTMAASTIEAGGTVLYIDWENEIVPYYAEALGVPIADKTKFMLSQPETLEDGMVVAYTAAKHGVDLVVFDSVAAGVPRKLLEGKLDEVANIGQVGLLAALWSKFLPKLKATVNKTGTAVIGISQLREKINTSGYGAETSDTQGGRAWKFYSALRMKLQRIKTEKTKVVNNLKNITEDRVTGAQIKVKLDKCKVSPQQGNEEVMYIRQGEGIDDYRTIIEIGVAHNIVKKSGAWIEWTNTKTDETYKTQGMEKFRKCMIETEGAMQALYEQVLPYLGATVTPVEDEADADEDLSAMFDALSS
jgi:recombination protein RecA